MVAGLAGVTAAKGSREKVFGVIAMGNAAAAVAEEEVADIPVKSPRSSLLAAGFDTSESG